MIDGGHRETIKSCEDQLQRQFGLCYSPKVFTSYRSHQGSRKLTKIRNRWINIAKFSESQLNVLEPSENWDQGRFLNEPRQELNETYYQLADDKIQNDKGDKSYLIETCVEFSGKLTVAAAYDWLFIGDLKSGDRFAAVLYVRVRDLFKGCGLSTLLKSKEIELAAENKCDFIQTYHKAENPDFLAAIAPSLKAGFVLYHGERTGQEFYEEGGAIHLRKYLSRKTRTDVKVTFKNGPSFKSTKENQLILDYLSGLKDYPGKHIKEIELYGEK